LGRAVSPTTFTMNKNHGHKVLPATFKINKRNHGHKVLPATFKINKRNHGHKRFTSHIQNQQEEPWS
jgi:hypothetical protein